MRLIRQILRLSLMTVLIGGVYASASFGSTTAEYRAKIDDARSIVWDLLSGIANVSADQKPGDFDAAAVAELRQLLPAVYRVETSSGELAVSHQWMHSKLDQFVTSDDMLMQAAILTEIDERLLSIDTKIAQVERAVTDDRLNKDAQKQKLAEILNREEYQKPSTNQESFLARWFTSFLRWLDSLFQRAPIPEGTTSGMPNFAYWLQIFLFVVVIGLIGFVLYKLLPAIFPNLRRRKKETKQDRVILGEKIAFDEDSSVLFNEAERLARDGDIRGAIRKGYIAVLCELSDRKMIGLARHKTNRDYLRDIREQRVLHEDMRTLTGAFETHWYGLHESDPNAWEMFKAKYKETIGKI